MWTRYASACRNLLFETHWFNAESSQRSLRETPARASNLELCPAYNGQVTCCQSGLEHEQALHFAYWKQIFKGKIARVKLAKEATLEVKDDPAFRAASEEERLCHATPPRRTRRGCPARRTCVICNGFRKVLDPAAGHGRCMSSLLLYTAGMICFACDAHWKQEVHIEKEKLLRVLIPEGNCVELWTECQDFGREARELFEAILDSSLAIRSRWPLEYLHMFEDQQQLCDWTHDVIAMHPFIRPGELEREATPPIKAHRRLANGTGEPMREYDVFQEGRRSTFETSWDMGPNYSGSAGLAPGCVHAVVLVWLRERTARGSGLAQVPMTGLMPNELQALPMSAAGLTQMPMGCQNGVMMQQVTSPLPGHSGQCEAM
eukprot:g6216.t1